MLVQATVFVTDIRNDPSLLRTLSISINYECVMFYTVDSKNKHLTYYIAPTLKEKKFNDPDTRTRPSIRLNLPQPKVSSSRAMTSRDQFNKLTSVINGLLE